MCPDRQPVFACTDIKRRACVQLLLGEAELRGRWVGDTFSAVVSVNLSYQLPGAHKLPAPLDVSLAILDPHYQASMTCVLFLCVFSA